MPRQQNMLLLKFHNGLNSKSKSSITRSYQTCIFKTFVYIFGGRFRYFKISRTRI